MPASQTADSAAGRATGPPSSSPRTASVTSVTGLWVTTAWSQPGMLAAGANTELANVSGITTMNPAICTDSALRSEVPISAITQDSAKPQVRIRPKAASASTTPVCGRKPKATPTATVITAPQPMRVTSATIRPATTALRAIGRDRKRSMRPLAKSLFRPTAVCVAMNATPWTTSPGSTNCM
jgi:hypothetical protein